MATERTLARKQAARPAKRTKTKAPPEIRIRPKYPPTLRGWLQRILGKYPPPRRHMTARTWSIGILMLLGLGCILLRLVDLQLVQGEGLLKQAQVQQQALHRPFIPRRAIVDRHSIVNQQAELLAVDRPVFTLWARPSLLSQPNLSEVAESLVPILKRTRTSILEQLASVESDRSIRLERWLTPEQARLVQRLYQDGLELVSERQRIYPQKELVSDVVGYVDLDHQGQAGLEYSQQSLLERSIQPVVIPRDGYGRLLAAEVPDNVLQSSETVLQLTLDMRLQRVARNALKEQVQQFQAARGTVLVVDPTSGEILALASEPTYDPNRYYDGYDPRLFRNWAVADLYEPGSTFKPINVAIALDTGVIEPDTVVFDQGRLQIGGWPVQNYDFEQRGAHGYMSVTDILRRSSNVGMVHLMERLTPSQYYEALLKVGLNQSTGVDLPFEAVSQLKQRSEFELIRIERATASFGQGFSLTPMGLAAMHCIIANGGYQVTPHVIRGLVEVDTDQLVWQPSRPDPVRIFSGETTRTVREQMRQVVDSGTGQTAKIEGYDIAGKTGTAQKASRYGGYIPGKRVTSFVGYFPSYQPKYVVLAIVDEPRGDDAYGSSVSAPIVKSVIEEIIAMEGIGINLREGI